MNALLVDDNRYVVEGLKCQIDWNEFGISQVFGCNSVAEAIQIISENSIDILFCDIEMPAQNGFELLAWIKRKKMIPEVALLTSYADFQYAQQAVEYDVYKYLLKPISSDELESAVSEMVRNHESKTKDIQLRAAGERWMSNRAEARARFWQSCFSAIKSGESEYMFQKLVREGLPYEEKDLLLPVTIRFSFSGRKWNESLLTHVCENIVRELSAKPRLRYGAVYSFGEELYLLDFLLTDPAQRDLVSAVMDDFSEDVMELLDLKVTCLVGGVCSPTDILSQLPPLIPAAYREHIAQSDIYTAANGEITAASYPKPDAGAWKMLLQRGDYDAFSESLHDFFCRASADKSAEVDFVGFMIVEWTILVNDFLKVNTAFDSIAKFRGERFSQWVMVDFEKLERLILDEAFELTRLTAGADEQQLVTSMVKDYINDNLAEVSRASVAKALSFSPNYLSKLFSSVEGITLVNYIQNQRMTKAMELLANSNYDISQIALEVGYSNFSHFSKRFRSFVGCAPNEYRKKVMRERERK